MSEISDAIAKGFRQGLEGFKRDAEQAVMNLETTQEAVHVAFGELSAHEAKRPAIERKAMVELMQQENPVSGKLYTQTAASDNLDLVEIFRGWRQERNRLTGEAEYLKMKTRVDDHRAEIAIEMLRIAGHNL